MLQPVQLHHGPCDRVGANEAKVKQVGDVEEEVVEEVLVDDRLAVLLHERGTRLRQGAVPYEAGTEGRRRVTVQRRPC